jgi:glutamyl-tRNA reductase
VTTSTRTIAGVSISHSHATVDQLEAAAAPSAREAVGDLLAAGAEEAIVLQTCNRVEGYVVADTVGEGHAILAELVGEAPAEVVVEMGHAESLRHLLRVAAGLESLVIGEDQILGQVREAYEDARAVGGIGPMLEDGVTKAIHVGERARTETAINEGVVSLASAAVRLAGEELDLGSATGLVVGAGEMGTLAATALAEAVDRLVIANRTVSHAEHIASEVDHEAAVGIGLDGLGEALSEADVAVAATGSEGRLVEPGTVAAAGETFVIDLGQPRDIPPVGAPGVTVRDLDDLEAVTERTHERRERAAEHVETIIDEEFDRLLTGYKRKRADRVISAMYESAERVKATEVERAAGELDLDGEERAVVESMADSIVSQLLAAPTNSLRDAAEEDDWATINTALQLFDPDFGPDATEPPAFVKGMDPGDIPEAMREEMPAAVLDQLEE